ncbi:hypothetical protein [uncultured Brachyspira sp.]|uniref:hypothetical protein n=1 Tax=uncultured Brachyspira sp. TaxID=221953 RepID=UPI0025E7378E|nr:hypothetical protein [uncultured Brachyspira sp.]
MKTFIKTIFTILMMISFVFAVSCLNDFTKTGEGIDKKYAGKYFSSSIEKNAKGIIIENGKADFTVNNDGSIEGVINIDGEAIEIKFSKGNIFKTADNNYTAEADLIGELDKYTFTFNDKIMELNIANDNYTISGSLIRK